jgi:hypothetical protein
MSDMEYVYHLLFFQYTEDDSVYMRFAAIKQLAKLLVFHCFTAPLGLATEAKNRGSQSVEPFQSCR